MITIAMGKKRRTRQQKIIAKLRRELAEQKAGTVKKIKSKSANTVSQKSDKKQKTLRTLSLEDNHSLDEKKVKKAEKLAFAYNPKLIKKDLIKTLLLSLIFLALILILKFVRLEELFFHQ